MKTYKRSGKYEFSPPEIYDMRVQIPSMIQEKTGIDRRIALMKDELKKLKAQGEAMLTNSENLSKKVEDGFETRVQDCHRTRDWQNKQWVFTAIDSGIELCREPFTNDDMQMEIDDDGLTLMDIEYRRLKREMADNLDKAGASDSTIALVTEDFTNPKHDEPTQEDEPADQPATESDETPNEEE